MSAFTKITRQYLADRVSARWDDQYPRGGDNFGDDKHVISQKLRNLLAPIDPDEVNAIIGNDSWTQVPECDVCGKRKDFAVRICLGYGEKQTDLCPRCVSKLVKKALS